MNVFLMDAALPVLIDSGIYRNLSGRLCGGCGGCGDRSGSFWKLMS